MSVLITPNARLAAYLRSLGHPPVRSEAGERLPFAWEDRAVLLLAAHFLRDAARRRPVAATHPASR